MSEQEPEMRLVSTWESLTKDNEGEAHIHTLRKYEVEPGEVDEELFITRAAPTIIRAARFKKAVREGSVSLLAGDSQIGYRGEEPFHDERAMSLFMQVLRTIKPDNVVFTGDMIDLPEMSRFDQRPDWQRSTQRSLDRYHSFLAETRANAPDARIVVVHGNHELRLDRMIRNDAAALLGIRRANAERELSVLTLQYLARYDELGVEAVDGYPNAAHWLEDNIKVTHGTNTQKGGSNAARYLNQEDQTTIYGHSHRMEVAYRTIATRLGQRTIAAASPGCLARTDGAVPGVYYSVDSEGRTVSRAQNWQQGVLIINHTPEEHHITPIRFAENGATVHGKLIA